ncbi:MAG: hypothetical protein AUG51_23040 [Acidobacteria bacterium 13_1_20CM_3_53_8]|nr:MAG: hypothetical protein AUG51_23040 [Acidobacteria bacterium 13_1_20CM_3_53_8]
MLLKPLRSQRILCASAVNINSNQHPTENYYVGIAPASSHAKFVLNKDALYASTSIASALSVSFKIRTHSI